MAPVLAPVLALDPALALPLTLALALALASSLPSACAFVLTLAPDPYSIASAIVQLNPCLLLITALNLV